MVRTRSKSSPQETETLIVTDPFDEYPPNVSYSHWRRETHDCQDENTNYGSENPLHIVHNVSYAVPINGYNTWGNGKPYQTVVNGNPNLWAPAFGHPYISDNGIDSIINRSSPHRPMVDLPLFLFELKDLPGMLKEAHTFGKQLPRAMELIRDAGRSLLYGRNRTERVARGLGGGLLSYNMGWRPLMNDLAAMLNLTSAIARRQAELKQLASSRGYRKRVNIGEFHNIPVAVNGYLGGVTLGAIFGSYTEAIESRRWAVCRWVPTFSPLSVDTSEAAAVRSLLGLNLSPSTLWNAIPFSFLIDYFVGVGDYLDTFRNSIEMRFDGGSVMQYSKLTVTRTITNKYWFGTGGNGSVVTEIKSRSPISGGLRLPAFTPFLSGGQVSNLASLSVARRSSWRN